MRRFLNQHLRHRVTESEEASLSHLGMCSDMSSVMCHVSAVFLLLDFLYFFFDPFSHSQSFPVTTVVHIPSRHPLPSPGFPVMCAPTTTSVTLVTHRKITCTTAVILLPNRVVLHHKQQLQQQQHQQQQKQGRGKPKVPHPNKRDRRKKMGRVVDVSCSDMQRWEGRERDS